MSYSDHFGVYRTACDSPGQDSKNSQDKPPGTEHPGQYSGTVHRDRTPGTEGLGEGPQDRTHRTRQPGHDSWDRILGTRYL